MKVLIANPPWETDKGFGCRSNSRWPHVRKDKQLPFPVYIAYSASVLEKEGVEVAIIDAVANDYNSKDFINAIIEENPSSIFLETSTPTINQDLENAKRIKNTLPELKIFLFGPHATVFHEEILEEFDFLDGIVRGEYEYTIRDLAKNNSYSSIKGLTYRLSDKIIANDNRSFIESLDELPFPSWHHFNMNVYDSFIHSKPSAMMITSRGCPFSCTFCLWPDVMYGHKQRCRSAKNICDEIDRLIELFGVKEIKFDDDTFALNKNHVESICDEMIRRNHHKKITWNCFGHISQDSGGLYHKMAKAGCTKIAFGIESGSEKILRAVSKKIDLDKAKRVVNICRKLGIEVHCDFMIGFPYETKADMERSIKTSIKLDPDYIQVSYVVPYPGTKMYDKGLEENFLLYPYDWTRYASCSVAIDAKNISIEETEKTYMDFWKRFYLRPRYAFNRIRKMFGSKSEFLKTVRGAHSFYKRFVVQ